MVILDATTTGADSGDLSTNIELGLAEAGVSVRDILRVQLVVEELSVNAFAHGNASTLNLKVTRSQERLSLQVTYDGDEFDPTKTAQPNTDLDCSRRPIGGLGLHIVRELAQVFSYRREAGQNSVTIDLSPFDEGTPGETADAN